MRRLLSHASGRSRKIDGVVFSIRPYHQRSARAALSRVAFEIKSLGKIP
jgi:hypothetical protein